MGVEVWAFAALIAVLVAYLLPFLVRRREIAGQSHVQDRYSAELRVLDTGLAAADPDEACERSGHAELFRRRPEVKAMNRPAVRNVRALRTERELTRARKAHAQARERRRVAASHRGVVACVLLGVALGAWVTGALTSLPWWPALVPSLLLGVSMVAGRRAAKASAGADQRERQRITELERELRSLTGRRPSVPVVSTPKVRETGSGTDSQDLRRPDFDKAVLSSEGSTSVHVAPRFVQESFRARAKASGWTRTSGEASSDGPERTAQEEQRQEQARPTTRSASRPASRPASKAGDKKTGDRTEQKAGKAVPGARRAAAGAQASTRPSRPAQAEDLKAEDVKTEDVEDVESGDARSRAAAAPRDSGDRSPDALASAGSSERAERGASRGSADSDRSAQPAERAGSGRKKEPEGGSAGAATAPGASATASSTATTSSSVSAASSVASSTSSSAATTALSAASAAGTLTTATPPQGWKPVHVPAPTYTLAPRAPRRAYSEPVLDQGESAPVPARPHTVRTFSAPDFEEQDFQPIDLDAILERRRAAGE